MIKDSVWAKFAYTASDGKTYQVDYYNLDVIISVGYRVKSQRGTQFRQWANKVLKEYLLKGYSINQRINQLENKMDSRLTAHRNDNQFTLEYGSNHKIRIGKRIAELRKEKGLSQFKLAQLTGIDSSNIGKIELGKYNPSLEILSRIGDALGVEIDFRPI